ncbi:hypothetical protein R2083_07170 [Nitrosomonas sp. Is35]|uniref:hypothetical protein n=1 Tax=Nitrosomonas sp. Is35 TaxID=3080534 RepID=UPI00294AE6C2|nr:hypothetical protein [Nitrosomonas sp. Is35]MDV6347296.1 hypothetical protein [Nitrosomonas sp. Is35]
MTTSNQIPASESATVSNIERLKELERARLIISKCISVIGFIDCGEMMEQVNGLTRTLSLSWEQMLGAFLVVESVVPLVREVREIVIKMSPCEEITHDICRSTDAFFFMTSFSLKLARIHLDKARDRTILFRKDVEVCKMVGLPTEWNSQEECFSMDSIGICGLFHVMQLTDDRAGDIYEGVNALCELISETLEGDGNVHDSLH